MRIHSIRYPHRISLIGTTETKEAVRLIADKISRPPSNVSQALAAHEFLRLVRTTPLARNTTWPLFMHMRTICRATIDDLRNKSGIRNATVAWGRPANRTAHKVVYMLSYAASPHMHSSDELPRYPANPKQVDLLMSILLYDALQDFDVSLLEDPDAFRDLLRVAKWSGLQHNLGMYLDCFPGTGDKQKPLPPVLTP